MTFASFNPRPTLLLKVFKNCNILKFADIANVVNCIFMNIFFCKEYFSIYNKNFKLVY